MTENSSPPNRATTSVSRALPRMIAAASTSALLPARWPCRSLTLLKPSMSMNSTDSGRPRARGALGFAAQHQVEKPRVVETGEVVGDRQRLRLLKGQGVVERDGRRLQKRPQRQHHGGPKRGCRRRRLRIKAHQRADRPIAADQRKGDDGAGRRVVGPESFERSAAQNSAPCRKTELTAVQSAGPMLGVRPWSATTAAWPFTS